MLFLLIFLFFKVTKKKEIIEVSLEVARIKKIKREREKSNKGSADKGYGQMLEEAEFIKINANDGNLFYLQRDVAGLCG